MSEHEKNEPLGKPEFMGLFIVPMPDFMPKPGDILCVINGSENLVHRLNGPYERDDLREVLNIWANEYLECGTRFAFYYEPLDGGPPVTGETQVWHFSKLN